MKVEKSSRHSKITGNFCENLVLYWLSKYHFECAIVDHTGIDVIAHNPNTDELMGISVKGRSRIEGKEKANVLIRNKEFDNVKKACKAFNCKPYFAFVIDEKDKIHCYILTMEHLLELFPKGKTYCSWKMTKEHFEKYKRDKNIKNFEFTCKTPIWWNK